MFTGSTFEYRGTQSVRSAYIFNRIQPEDINGDGDFDDVVEDINEGTVRRNSSFLPRDYTGGVPESFINRDNDFLQTGFNMWLEGFNLQYLFTYSSQKNRGYGRIFNTFSPAGVENTFFQYNSSSGKTLVHSLKGFKDFYTGDVRHRLTFGGRLLMTATSVFRIDSATQMAENAR